MSEGEAHQNREPASPPDWSELTLRIERGDCAAMEELCRIFGRGIRYFLLRNLGPDELEDKVHDCFLTVVTAIRKGGMNDPGRLMAYVRTVVKRKIATAIDDAVTRRGRDIDSKDVMLSVPDRAADPERRLAEQEKAEIAARVFRGLSERDREILNRYYIKEQPQHEICSELGLSYNQFHTLKSRAKARLGLLGRTLAAKNNLNYSK